MQKADIWSCGIILFAILFGRYPFDAREPRFARKIVKAQYSLPMVRIFPARRDHTHRAECVNVNWSFWAKASTALQLTCTGRAYRPHGICAFSLLPREQSTMRTLIKPNPVCCSLADLCPCLLQNPGVSPDCLDMLTRVLVADPERRISMEEIKKHPWFTRGLPPGALEMNEFLLQGLSTMDDVSPCPLLHIHPSAKPLPQGARPIFLNFTCSHLSLSRACLYALLCAGKYCMALLLTPRNGCCRAGPNTKGR